MSNETNFDLKNPDTYQFWVDVSMRYSDQDELGHVNNVSYAAYIEAGRAEYLLSLFIDNKKHPNLDYLLANLSINFIQECHWPGTIKVGCRLTAVGSKSIASSYGVFKDGICRATADSVNVFFDKTTRKSVTPPIDVKKHFLEELSK